MRASLRPSQPIEFPPERRELRLHIRIVLGEAREHADAPHALALLRARRERPCRRAAAEKGNELPSPHGIVPGEPRGMRKYYQTSPQKCVTKVTQFLPRVNGRTSTCPPWQ